jgi:hypothetical protein
VQGIGFVLCTVELCLELCILVEDDLEGDGEALLNNILDGIRVGRHGEEGLEKQGCC